MQHLILLKQFNYELVLMVSKVSMIVNLEVVHFRIYNLISFVVCEYNNSSSYRNEVQNTCKKKTML